MTVTLSTEESLIPTAEQLCLVDPGLSPIVDEAAEQATRSYPPCHAPCPTCGVWVLTGETPAGLQVTVDVQALTYAPVWLPNTPRPVLYASRGYPVHRCGAAPGC